MANINRPIIPEGNDTSLRIKLQYFKDGEYLDFDLTQVSDLKVMLTCSKHNTEIILEYTIDEQDHSIIIAPIDYRLLHSNASYGISVSGIDTEQKHFKFTMLPREGFLVIPNTSGMHVTDEVQIIDISGRVGWGVNLPEYSLSTTGSNVILNRDGKQVSLVDDIYENMTLQEALAGTSGTGKLISANVLLNTIDAWNKVYPITVTYNSSTGVYSTTKTFEQMESAILDGKIPVLIYNNWWHIYGIRDVINNEYLFYSFGGAYRYIYFFKWKSGQSPVYSYISIVLPAMKVEEVEEGTGTTPKSLTAKVLHDSIESVAPEYTLTKSGTNIILNKDGEQVSSVVDSNTTYNVMTQAQANAGTSATGLRISPKVLADTIANKTAVLTSQLESVIIDVRNNSANIQENSEDIYRLREIAYNHTLKLKSIEGYMYSYDARISHLESITYSNGVQIGELYAYCNDLFNQTNVLFSYSAVNKDAIKNLQDRVAYLESKIK